MSILMNKFGRCLKVMEKQSNAWNKELSDTKEQRDALRNLLEQIECCIESELEQTPLGRKNENIKSKLLIKLYANMDGLLCKMREKLSAMQKASNEILISFNAAKRSLMKNSLNAASDDMANRPALSTILLAMLSLVDIMQEHCGKMEIILWNFETITLKSLSSLERINELKSLLSEWSDGGKVLHFVNEILLWCSHIER